MIANRASVVRPTKEIWLKEDDMIQDAVALAKRLARKHHARWSKYDDALALLRSSDDGGRSTPGERARRLLQNARRVSNYPDRERDSLLTDRANIRRALDAPLSKALGLMVSLELVEGQLQEVERALKERRAQESELERDGHYREHRPLIDALHTLGIAHGHYSVLRPEEWRAIAMYIRRKVDARIKGLPRLRTDRETRGPDGRRHSFWDPFGLPHRRDS